MINMYYDFPNTLDNGLNCVSPNVSGTITNSTISSLINHLSIQAKVDIEKLDTDIVNSSILGSIEGTNIIGNAHDC